MSDQLLLVSHPGEQPKDKPGIGIRYGISAIYNGERQYLRRSWAWARRRAGGRPTPEGQQHAWWSTDAAVAWTGKTIGATKGHITNYGRSSRFVGVTSVRIVPVFTVATDVAPCSLLRTLSWVLEGYGISQDDLSYLRVLHDQLLERGHDS